MEHRNANLRHSVELATEAANGGASLIVLPELSNCGYLFANRQDAFDHAEIVPNGRSVQVWIDFASRHRVYLAAGVSELDGMQLFNTSVLIGPDGFIGKYRKAHLWNLEKLWFTPGNTGFSRTIPATPPVSHSIFFHLSACGVTTATAKVDSAR